MKTILLSPDAPDTTGGGGGQVATEAPSGAELFGAASTTPPGATTETQPHEAVEPDVTPEPTAEPATDAIRSPALTKEDIAELVNSISASRPAQATQPAQQQPQMSEAQLEQMFNVWKPTPEFIAQLRHESPETQMQALTSLRDGMIRQAMTMAQYYVKQQLDSMRQEFTGQMTPLHEYVSEARATAFRDDFFTQNPDLEPYEQLVDAVAAKLYQSGGDGFLKLDRAGRMKLFADESKKLVQNMIAKGGGSDAANVVAFTTSGNGGKGGTQTTSRRMSTLTSGGQPGSRGAGGGKATTGNKHVDDGLAALD